MGMESFFFNIVSAKVTMSEDSVIEYLKTKFNIKSYYINDGFLFFKKKVKVDSRYILEETYLFDFSEDEKNMIISFETCFSNYDYKIKLAYQIYQTLKSQYSIVLEYGSLKNFQDSSFQEFSEWLSSTHTEKYNIFTEKYGNLHENALPEDFYKLVRGK